MNDFIKSNRLQPVILHKGTNFYLLDKIVKNCYCIENKWVYISYGRFKIGNARGVILPEEEYVSDFHRLAYCVSVKYHDEITGNLVESFTTQIPFAIEIADIEWQMTIPKNTIIKITDTNNSVVELCDFKISEPCTCILDQNIVVTGY